MSVLPVNSENRTEPPPSMMTGYVDSSNAVPSNKQCRNRSWPPLPTIPHVLFADATTNLQLVNESFT